MTTRFRRGRRPADMRHFAFPREPGRTNLGAAVRPRPKSRLADVPPGRVIAGLAAFAGCLAVLLLLLAAVI